MQLRIVLGKKATLHGGARLKPTGFDATRNGHAAMTLLVRVQMRPMPWTALATKASTASRLVVEPVDREQVD